MVGGAVALVPGEAVFRVAGVEFDQEAVALDLGDDRGEGDGQALAVAALDGLVRPSKRPQGQSVHEYEHVAFVGAPEEFAFGAGGGEECGQRALGQLRDASGHR